MLRGEYGSQLGALLGGRGQPGVVPVGEHIPTLVSSPRSCRPRFASSWWSQARAVFQSLMTVRTDTPSVSAVSSTE